MGVIIRQSIITTIISYIGVGIGYVNLLYLYPRFLSPEQVGLMRTLQDSAILLAQFAQFGLAQSIIRFFPRFMGNQTRSRNFINIILLAGMIAFGFFLIGFFVFEQQILGYFQANAKEFVHYSSLALWLTFITVITTLLEVYSRSLLKNVLPNLLKEIVVRLLLAILVLLYFKGVLTFPQVMISSVLIYVFCLLILVGTLLAQGYLDLKIEIRSIEPALWKDLINFSLLSFAGTAGLIIIGKVDSLMVAGLLGLESVAIYTTSAYMATVIEIPKRAMTQIASPLISRGFEKNDLAEVKNIYHKTSLNQFILGTLLLIGIVSNLDSIFLLMPKGEIYETGKWVVIIVGAGKLVDMLFGPSSELIVYSKYFRFNIILILILAVVIITSNNILIPIYGIEGAAIGTAVTLIVFNLVKFIFIWIKMRLQPFSSAFIKVIVIGAAAWIAQYLMPRVDWVIADMISRSAVITTVFGVLTLWFRVSPDGNNLFIKIVRYFKIPI
ncbi:MAG: oligosaccharide flippase family protein [Cyclobacteriaceae bacterium]|nr:oligosaccharide flippase family protein [Cyclobacteriaceae bacterium]